MTTVKYCDLCGRKTNFHVYVMGISTQRDFCKKCWNKVEKFLKTLKTKKQASPASKEDVLQG